MRRLGWLVGAVTLLGSGAYVFVYLYRWEWHRAMLVALLFVAGEVAMAVAMLTRRIQRVEARLQLARSPGAAPPAPDTAARQRMAGRLAAARPDRHPFAWLRTPPDRLAVFIPVLLGAGVLGSALSWLLERVAARTTEPAREGMLAADLAAIAFPTGGLVVDQAAALLLGPPYRDAPGLRLLLGPPDPSR